MAKEESKKKGVNKSLSDAAAQLGHFGGLKGGKKRALVLSKTQREEIARSGGLAKAAKARSKNKGSKAAKAAAKKKDKK